MKYSQQWLSWALAASLPVVQGVMDYPNCVDGPLSTNLVCDQTASPADRAAGLIKAMNITEKLGNLVNKGQGAPRIGLPPYEWWSEALHGVAASPGVSFTPERGNFSSATSFANPITLSAAFDDDLVEKVATVISTEARAFANGGKAGLDFWTPNINPYKDPRWGRGMETPGEDPLRLKHYVKALLRGLEGDDPSTRKVIATCKHYAAYDLERWNGITRYAFDAVVSLQDLSEYYLPPFQQCARDSRVGSFMCSYNSVNGTPACANEYLMTEILKKHWGWDGEGRYITSDCNAVENFYADHNYSATAAEAAAAAISAGTDTICEVGPTTDVVGAYNQTLLPEATIDTALKRLYEGLVRAGYFDPPTSPYRSLSWPDVNTAEAQALALQSATDGLVLKKNLNGTLPLDKGKKLAMIGHWANNYVARSMLGGYSGLPPLYSTPVSAALELDGFNVTFAGGPPASATTGDDDNWTAPALAAAANADVVLYFGGIDTSVESEDKDRVSITWPRPQLDLIANLSSLGKPLVVVELGDQVDDSPLLKNDGVGAMLWTGYPGQDGGRAVMRAVTGATPPAGRLPVTMYPASYVDAVPMTEMGLRPDGKNPGRTYRWFDDAVLPFGFGLHYTSFDASFAAPGVANKTIAIADLLEGCKEAHNDLCPFPDVGVEVTNTGDKVTSDFVALGFVKGEYGPKPYSRKTLVAYTRLRTVKPGDAAAAKLLMTIGALARTDEKGNLVLYPGEYKMLLDEPTQSELTFTLTGEAAVLDELPQPSAK